MPAEPISEKDGIVLLSFTEEKAPDPDGMRLKLHWFCQKQPGKDMRLRIELVRKGQVVQRTVHRIGYQLFPTSFWSASKYVTEIYGVPLRDGINSNTIDGIVLSVID